MADVDIICPGCGKTVTISEFADISTMVCKCGSGFAAPSKKQTVQPVSAPRLKRSQDLQIATTFTQPSQRASGEIVQAKTTRKKIRHPVIPLHVFLSWTVFLMIGAIMWLLRYGGALSKDGLQTMGEIAPFVAIAFHIMITLKAFKDSVFAGLLCLLIPFYSLYYLFSVCDDFYMRAVVAGLMVGFGQDSAEQFQSIAQTVIKSVNDWIMTGG